MPPPDFFEEFLKDFGEFQKDYALSFEPFDDAEINQISDLPDHIKCASHIFNLIGSVDTLKLLKADIRHKYSTAISNYNSLWNLMKSSC